MKMEWNNDIIKTAVYFDNKSELQKTMELSDRVLEIIDDKVNETVSRGDLQGIVEAIIMDAISFGRVLGVRK